LEGRRGVLGKRRVRWSDVRGGEDEKGRRGGGKWRGLG
jgi:hypothetical protein